MTPKHSIALAEWLGGQHHGPETTWSDVAGIEDATPTSLCFVEGQMPSECAAGILLTHSPIEDRCCIVVDDPKRAFIHVLEAMFHVEHLRGIHPKAEIDPSAFVHATATIHAGVVIMERCSVGAGTVLYPNVVLYPKTEVQERVRIHAGSVIGADGFGYHPSPQGVVKIPHIGRVVIENDVEIGANCTVDRAFLHETRIGAGTKIDNLVHIGHNNRLGKQVIIAAQTGLSGSVTVGDGVVMGGQIGVVEHTNIGDGARIGAQSGVLRNVQENETVLGTPAEPAMKMKRMYAALRNLPKD